MAEIDHFMPLLMEHEEEGLLCPVMSHGNVHFMWIKHSNLYCILVLDVAVTHWLMRGQRCDVHRDVVSSKMK